MEQNSFCRRVHCTGTAPNLNERERVARNRETADQFPSQQGHFPSGARTSVFRTMQAAATTKPGTAPEGPLSASNKFSWVRHAFTSMRASRNFYASARAQPQRSAMIGTPKNAPAPRRGNESATSSVAANHTDNFRGPKKLSRVSAFQLLSDSDSKICRPAALKTGSRSNRSICESARRPRFFRDTKKPRTSGRSRL